MDGVPPIADIEPVSRLDFFALTVEIVDREELMDARLDRLDHRPGSFRHIQSRCLVKVGRGVSRIIVPYDLLRQLRAIDRDASLLRPNLGQSV